MEEVCQPTSGARAAGDAGTFDVYKASFPVLAVVGQTASGKTDFSLDLVEHLDLHAEVVCADAFQLYRGMDIGSAKISVGERRGIPHRQLDVLDLSQEASVAAYQRLARQDLEQVWESGKVAVLCGGSGLYVRALLDDLAFPPQDAQVRAALTAELERSGPEAMHRRLAEVDEVSAQRLKLEDTRRVIRALEVFELTGRPFSATLPTYEYLYPACQLALRWDNELLDKRIDLRTQQMFEQGFVQEVQELLEQGLADNRTAFAATGYAQVAAYLRGEKTLEQAREEVAAATKKLARKQLKWFRRDPRITWLEGTASREEQLELATRTWQTACENWQKTCEKMQVAREANNA